MKSLTDLYSKDSGPYAPRELPVLKESIIPPVAPLPVQDAAGQVLPIGLEKAPDIETPPGLPQEYVEINLKNQPLPAVVDMTTIAEAQAKPLSARLMPGGESLCNVTDIPYTPGYESKLVQDRINQGPRVFVSRAQREKFERDLDEKTAKAEKPKGPTVAHPDTLRAGTFITGESQVYRPV